jgi:hypothetical protein
MIETSNCSCKLPPWVTILFARLFLVDLHNELFLNLEAMELHVVDEGWWRET